MLNIKLKKLFLPRFIANYENIAVQCEEQNQSCVAYLEALVDLELEQRKHNKIARILQQAKIPQIKTLESFDLNHLKNISLSKVEALAKGDFIDRAENLLLFGNAGTGKTHLALALMQQWCFQGRKVAYYNASSLLQELLQAKKENTLIKFIKKLDRLAILVIDNISYLTCTKEESDVLFTLLADRYERKSLLITSNLSFNDWHKIFTDTITMQAAIDRLIHHAIILEMQGESYRIKVAKERKNGA